MKFLARPLLVAAACLVAAPAEAQPRQLVEPNPGTGAFQYILATQGLTPLTRPEQLRHSPARTLLIVLGNSQPLHLVPDGLATFIDRGGAVLLATDQKSWNDTWDTLLVEVDGPPVLAPRRFAYRGVQACPVITEFAAGHPVFRGVKQIATNRPSYVVRRENLPVLAWFPNPSFIHGVLMGHDRLPFAVTGERFQGQYLVLSDHSVFIDGMMLQKDNDNFTFAYNCVDWLRKGSSGERDRALLFVDGRIVTEFGKPIPYLPDRIPTPDLDKALMTLEERDAFDRFLLNLTPKERLLQIALVALSIGLVGYGMYRLVRARHRIDEAVPLFALGLAQAEPGKNITELRAESTLAGGNLWEASQALAAAFFASIAPPGQPFSGPPIALVRGSAARGRSWTRLLGRLWDLAQQTVPSRVSPRRFRRLLADLESVKAALADGTLTLQTPGPKTPG
jgi:hypothetical protein